MSNELIPLDQLQTMSDAIARSGLFGIKKTEEALALMLVAQAEGVHPATITQDYDIIQGKATRKTHSVLARFQQAGGRVEWHELSEECADATFSHEKGTARISWTISQANKAGLTGKDNWKKYPRAMLRSRVIAEGVRAAYPAAIGGMMVSEEAQDLDEQAPRQSPAKNMGKADEVVREFAEEMRQAKTVLDLEAIGKAGGAYYTKQKMLEEYKALRSLYAEQKARIEAETIDMPEGEAETE